MKAEDKHRWKKIEDEDHLNHPKWECKDCGCIKTNQWGMITYRRNGIVYGLRRPDCIKEEIESQKTID